MQWAKTVVPERLESLAPALRDSDPIWFLNSPPSIETLAAPVVDLLFTPIVPENIFAREYVFGPAQSDTSAHSEKTNAAEKAHQDILRRLSARLISFGLVPYQSESIDLMVEFEGCLYLFEIKSATPENFHDQAGNGIVQLLKYQVAMRNESPIGVVPALVIQEPGSGDAVKFVSDMALIAGIKVVPLSLSSDWPSNTSELVVLAGR